MNRPKRDSLKSITIILLNYIYIVNYNHLHGLSLLSDIFGKIIIIKLQWITKNRPIVFSSFYEKNLQEITILYTAVIYYDTIISVK